MHPDDDVARNIRNEQMRDAMPSQEEVRAEHRKHLASEGCHICGEDDPDKLTEETPIVHSCSAYQSPPYDRDYANVICKDGHTSREARWWHAQQVQTDHDGKPTVVYECRITEDAKRPEQDDVLTRHGYQQPRAEAPVECVCGAPVWTIIYPRENGGDGA